MNRLIALSALTLAGTGGLALYQPEKFAEMFGMKADTPEQRHDIRSVRGGASLAMAGLLVVRPSSAGTLALVLAGATAGAAGSVAMEEGEPSQGTKTGIIVQGGLAAALLVGRTQLAASKAASAIADKVTS